MKKFILILSLAALSLPALALPKIGAMRDLGEGILPDATRESVREVVRTAARHLLNFRKETQLSDEQRQQLKTVLETHRPETRALVERGREARKAYAAAVKAHGPEASQTREAAQKLGDLARDRALLMARVAVEVRPLLTDDQIKRLETARAEIETLVDEAMSAAH